MMLDDRGLTCPAGSIRSLSIDLIRMAEPTPAC
jgi:hypothetical protein